MGSCANSAKASWSRLQESVTRSDRNWIRELDGRATGLISGMPFVLVRALLAALMLAIFIGSHLTWPDTVGYSGIYLTNWGVFVELIFFLVSVSASALAISRAGKAGAAELQSVVAHDPPSPTALGSTEVKAENLAPQGSAPQGSGSAPAIVILHYFLFAMIWPLSLLITVLYWLLLATPPHEFMSIMTHGGTTILLICDTVLSGHVYHLIRSLPLFLLGIVYVIFTRVYAAAGGLNATGQVYVYSFIDWINKEGSSAGFAMMILCVAFPGFVFLSWLLCRLRLFLIPYRDA